MKSITNAIKRTGKFVWDGLVVFEFNSMVAGDRCCFKWIFKSLNLSHIFSRSKALLWELLCYRARITRYSISIPRARWKLGIACVNESNFHSMDAHGRQSVVLLRPWIIYHDNVVRLAATLESWNFDRTFQLCANLLVYFVICHLS